MNKGPSTQLLSLRPRWLHTDEPLRYQMGVSFICPRHPHDGLPEHRLEMWFINPLDGEKPAAKDGLVFWREGMLDTLCLEPAPASGRWSHPLSVPGHWRGWVMQGRVYDSD